MSEPERIPEWAMREARGIDTCGHDHDGDGRCCRNTEADIARALAEAYARGREEAARVCLDMAEEITREEIPYHKREERSGAIVREMQSRRCAAAIRAGGA